MDRSTLLVTTAAESVPAIPTLLEINVPNVPLNILHFPLVMRVCVTLKVLLIILVTTMENVLVIITLLVTNATSVRMEQTIFQPVTSVLPNTGLLDGYSIYPIVKLVTVTRQDPQAIIVTSVLLDFSDFHLAKLANVTMMALQFTIVMK